MSPPSPPISLVLSTYQSQAHIGAALRSALAQDYSPLEILIADDGSTDGTVAIIERELATYCGPHTVILDPARDHLGVEHANRWIRQIRGQLVVRAAGDAVSRPDRVRRTVEAWQSAKVSLVAAPLKAAPAGPVAIDQILAETATLESDESTFAYEPEVLIRPGPLSTRHHRFGPGPILLFRACLMKGVYCLAEPLVERLAPAGPGQPQTLPAADPSIALETQRAEAAGIAVRRLEELFELKAAGLAGAQSSQTQILLQRRILAAARDWVDSRRKLMSQDLRPIWVEPAPAAEP